ncbi:hypothetical protein OH738_18140 [Streptomyces hirsutus]|uniref:hypothetical protein n=1 Tax=Streptomyces hirsutus TaxID=35620 RepID=UPI00386F8049|nr:hypothetical protein OH738_18140 [Streptomyces hirsutus]
MTTTNPQPYTGRDALNRAQARARRAFAKASKEGVRHDETLLPALAALVAEAAETLNRIASDAEALESTSQRHQKAIKAQEDKTRATLRKMQRGGGTQALRATQLLAQMDARPAHRGRPADDAHG